ncbi:MAG TPA: 7-cyano-7-deazaguanine synthase [Sphingomicrobium sp.]|nr:7-cyano-7-deazaguanine synthase [Sphingomicrobium sp.]
MKVLLFSGGLDSTALAHWQRPDRLLFLDYGHLPAAGERRAAIQIAGDLQLPLDLAVVNCRSCGSGDMAGEPAIGAGPSEFWPFRNQLLITLAAMKYAAEPALQLLIGTVQTDAIHPDGRVEFIEQMQQVLKLQGNSSLDAPAIQMSGQELQQKSKVPLSILSWAFSCHRSEYACGQCRGCNKHFQTLAMLEEGS